MSEALHSPVTAMPVEPSPEAVLEALLPRYIEARLFGALLDCAASEHANRQRAMKSATDNATELVEGLSREELEETLDALEEFTDEMPPYLADDVERGHLLDHLETIAAGEEGSSS